MQMDMNIENILDEVIKQSKYAFALQGVEIGKNFTFNSEGYEEISIPEEVTEKVIYSGIKVFSNEKHYVLVKNNVPLYKGYVDSEGAQKTVENDIQTTPDFMNYMLAIAKEDKENILTMLMDIQFMKKMETQMHLGFEKGSQEGHYEKL